jgi:hypothetical protein
MSPKPCAVCYLQEAQHKSTGAPLPSDPQDPHFERVVQYIDQLIADPTAIFRCPHLHVEAHNTMNKDCTQTLQDLWSLVEKKRACCTNPEFFKKYNITPQVDNVRTNKSQEDQLAEFVVLVEVGEFLVWHGRIYHGHLRRLEMLGRIIVNHGSGSAIVVPVSTNIWRSRGQ